MLAELPERRPVGCRPELGRGEVGGGARDEDLSAVGHVEQPSAPVDGGTAVVATVDRGERAGGRRNPNLQLTGRFGPERVDRGQHGGAGRGEHRQHPRRRST